MNTYLISRRSAGWLLQCLTLTLAYLTAVAVGELMILPTVGVAPFWPAAGIATASLIVGGLRLWPGVGLGAFLGAWIFGGAAGAPATPAVAALLAIGPTLQAIVGTLLFLHCRNGIRQGHSGAAALGLTLAGPLAAVVAPTVGLIGLAWLGLTNGGLEVATWMIWWAGEATGVVLAGPLAMFAFARIRRRWHGERWFILAPLALITVTLALGLQLVWSDAGLVGHYRVLQWHPDLATQLLPGGPAVTLGLPVASVLIGLLFTAFVFVGASRQRSIAEAVGTRTQALATQGRRLARALDIAKLANWELDPGARVIHMDERSFAMLGTSVAQEGGASLNVDDWLARFVHPEDRARLAQAFAALQQLAGRQDSETVEFRLLRRDGHQLHVQTGFDLDHGPDGRLRRVLGTTQDITDRKNRELALKNSEEYARSIIESSPDCIKVLNLEGELLEMTEHSLRVMEIPSFDEVRGTQWCSFWPEATGRQAVLAALETARGGGVGRVQERAPTFKGKEKWWDVVVTPIRGVDGKPARLLAVSRDITTEREALHAAQAASEAKSSFLAMMSHEIRTPMNGIVGMADVLAHESLSPDQADAVNTIRESAFALLGIIDDILDFSKVEAGRVELESLPVMPQPLAESVLAALSEYAAQRNVNLELSVAPELPATILSDPTRLRQILNNLIGNAIKFSGDRPGVRGQVQLRLQPAAEAPDQWQVLVRDNGIGIDAEAQDRLFEAFTQAEGNTTRRYGGTGLGLAICHQLATLFGGRITVESEPGAGSCFTVSMPLRATSLQAKEARAAALPAAATTQSQPGEADARAAGGLILVAEDDATNRAVIRRQLRLVGLAVEIAENGQQALTLWRRGGHTMLLTDLHMPELDGYELAACIRREESGSQRLPILALTANAAPDVADRCKALGFDGYLTKPLRLEQLEQAVARWQPAPPAAEPPARAVSPDPAAQDLDLSVLQGVFPDDAELVKQTLSEFPAAARPLVASLERAFRRAEFEQVRALAHRLKAMVRLLGAERLGELCQQLESVAETRDEGPHESVLERLLTGMDGLLKSVERAVTTRAPAVSA